MFRTATFLSFILLGILFTSWYKKYAVMRKSDIAAFERIIKEKYDPEAQSSSSAYQTRRGVVKDLWYSQEDDIRVHHRISSESSILTMVAKKNKVDLFENLENIHCLMQEKVYYSALHEPMQQVRFFSANDGTYHYSTQQFLAQRVKLSLHRLSGHSLPEEVDPMQSFLQGIAEDVSFSINNKIPEFHAEHFRANLKQSEVFPKISEQK